jgi:3-hydroxyacyl-CoA dehydrogenase
MLILSPDSQIVMNRNRVLADAKALCLNMAKDYKVPEPRGIHLPGATAKAAMDMAVDGFVAAGQATPHDKVVANHLSYVLSGGNVDISEELSEQYLLDLEHEMFMELVKTKATMARIQYMLENNKPLRN